MALKVTTGAGAPLGFLPDSPAGAGTIQELFSPADSRSAVIAVGANFSVPAYTVGSGRLTIWLDGLLCMTGADASKTQYQEIGATGAESTVIRWHQAIDTTYDIFVRVR